MGTVLGHPQALVYASAEHRSTLPRLAARGGRRERRPADGPPRSGRLQLGSAAAAPWRNGRRSGFKIRGSRERPGSSPGGATTSGRSGGHQPKPARESGALVAASALGHLPRSLLAGGLTGRVLAGTHELSGAERFPHWRRWEAAKLPLAVRSGLGRRLLRLSALRRADDERRGASGAPPVTSTSSSASLVPAGAPPTVLSLGAPAMSEFAPIMAANWGVSEPREGVVGPARVT